MDQPLLCEESYGDNHSGYAPAERPTEHHIEDGPPDRDVTLEIYMTEYDLAARRYENIYKASNRSVPLIGGPEYA